MANWFQRSFLLLQPLLEQLKPNESGFRVGNPKLPSAALLEVVLILLLFPARLPVQDVSKGNTKSKMIDNPICKNKTNSTWSVFL